MALTVTAINESVEPVIAIKPAIATSRNVFEFLDELV